MRSALLSCLFCVLALAPALAVTTVWIDTDPSIGSPFREVDDAFAFLFAINSPELKIAGVSTTYGNASLATTTRVQREISHRFGVDPIRVSPGARSPRDLGVKTEASEDLRRALQRHGHLTYLALGPLTDLATFQILHPQLAAQIDRVIFVGGRSPDRSMHLPPAGLITVHDANVVKDPAAVAHVLASSLPITLAPIEVSSQIMVDKTDLLALSRSGEAGKFLYDRSRGWLSFWQIWARMKGGPLFDTLPVLLLTDPSLTTIEKRYAYLEKGELIAVPHPASNCRVSFCSAIRPSARAAQLRCEIGMMK